MKRREKSSIDNVDVDITAMLDVVFILLIFFIVTASFNKEYGIAINKPEQTADSKSDDKPIIVVIGSDQAVWIDGRIIPANLLYANIVRAQAEQTSAEVVVKIAANAYTSNLVNALDQLRRAKVFDPPISLDI